MAKLVLESNEADPPTFCCERDDDAFVGSPFPLRLGDLTLVLDTARPGHVVEAAYRVGDGAWSELGIDGAEALLNAPRPDGSLTVQLPDRPLLAALAAAVEECERNGVGNASWAAGEALVLLRRCGLDLSGSDTENELIAGFAAAFELIPASVLDRVRSSAACEWFDAVQAATLSTEAAADGLIDAIEHFVHSSEDPRLTRAFAADPTATDDTASSRADIRVRSGSVVDVTWRVRGSDVEVVIVADPILGSPDPVWIQTVTPRVGELEVSVSVEHSIRNDSGVSIAQLGAGDGLDASSWVRVTDRYPDEDIGWFTESLASMSRMTAAQQLMRRACAYALFQNESDAQANVRHLVFAASRAATSALKLAPTFRKAQIREAWSSLGNQTVPLHELIAAAWTLALPELSDLPRRSVTAALAVGPLTRSTAAEARLYRAAAETDPSSVLLGRLAAEADERAASLTFPRGDSKDTVKSASGVFATEWLPSRDSPRKDPIAGYKWIEKAKKLIGEQKRSDDTEAAITDFKQVLED